MSSAQPVGGRFEIGELVRAGKTGEVFKARDLQTGNTVAVKRVHANVFESKLAVQRAERELTQLATLTSDGVAKILAQGLDSDLLWYAMEWADGRPLSTLVAELGPLPAKNASDLIGVIGKALGDAATVGVIHRDLAAKNILVAQDASVKLINFCIPSPTGTKVAGVPEFVAPEQVDGRPVDLRSNIYSAGAILYLLLTGKPPHVGADAASVHAAHKGAAVQPPSAAGTGISAAVDEVVLRALEKTPSKRFMTLPQLLSSLADAVAGKAAAPAVSPTPVVSATQPLGRAGSISAAGAGKAGGKGKPQAAAKTLLGMPAITAESASESNPAEGGEGPRTEKMAAQAEPSAGQPRISGSIEEGQAKKTVLEGQPANIASLKSTVPDSPMAKAAAAESATASETPTPAASETPAPTPAASETPAPAPAASETPAPAPAASETPAPTPAASETPAPAPAASETPA
ncbi:MAG: protein kinase, partial [Deltaproteobacteria bacterium]|nr:protein kinase [Deltaproteobacteria bacterium]